MRPIPYLVCVLCVQWIAVLQEELADPSTEGWHKTQVERRVQNRQRWIREIKSDMASADSELAKLRSALDELGMFIPRGYC